MEVAVYSSLESMKQDRALFKRNVLVPDAFNVDSFVQNMKAVFGQSVIVDILFV